MSPSTSRYNSYGQWIRTVGSLPDNAALTINVQACDGRVAWRLELEYRPGKPMGCLTYSQIVDKVPRSEGMVAVPLFNKNGLQTSWSCSKE